MFSENRNIWLAFAIALFISLGTFTASASSVTLNVSPQEISAGDTFTVDVFVEPDDKIAGMQFNLEFDETKVHVDSVTEGNLFTQSGLGTFFNNGLVEPGLLSNVYGTILGASNVSTPAAFATITMVVDEQDTATSTLNLTNVIISDPNGHAVDVDVTNATIKIMPFNDHRNEVVDSVDYIVEEKNSSQTLFSSWNIILTTLSSWI